jgi:hypothetical protein
MPHVVMSGIGCDCVTDILMCIGAIALKGKLNQSDLPDEQSMSERLILTCSQSYIGPQVYE